MVNLHPPPRTAKSCIGTHYRETISHPVQTRSAKGQTEVRIQYTKDREHERVEHETVEYLCQFSNSPFSIPFSNSSIFHLPILFLLPSTFIAVIRSGLTPGKKNIRTKKKSDKGRFVNDNPPHLLPQHYPNARLIQLLTHQKPEKN